MTYLPSYEQGNCAIVLDKDTIRVYEEEPQANINVNYVDYFINSHYLSKSGSIVYAPGSFNETCISDDLISTDFYYRYDLDNILIIFLIIALVGFYLPFKVFVRAFGRWLKV